MKLDVGAERFSSRGQLTQPAPRRVGAWLAGWRSRRHPPTSATCAGGCVGGCRTCHSVISQGASQGNPVWQGIHYLEQQRTFSKNPFRTNLNLPRHLTGLTPGCSRVSNSQAASSGPRRTNSGRPWPHSRSACHAKRAPTLGPRGKAGRPPQPANSRSCSGSPRCKACRFGLPMQRVALAMGMRAPPTQVLSVTVVRNPTCHHTTSTRRFRSAQLSFLHSF
jgi:hypothetical protein